MKKWNSPELVELNIRETAAKKDDAWNSWACPALSAGTCEAGKQNWGHCKDCPTYLAYTDSQNDSLS